MHITTYWNKNFPARRHYERLLRQLTVEQELHIRKKIWKQRIFPDMLIAAKYWFLSGALVNSPKIKPLWLQHLTFVESVKHVPHFKPIDDFADSMYIYPPSK